MTTKRVSGIFLGFVIALGMMLTSCSKDVNGVKDGDGDVSGEMGYFALAINTGPASKAISDPTGTADESKVNAIRVVLYNSDYIVAYSWDFTDIAGSTDLVLNSGPYQTVGKSVVKQAYKLLAIINPTDEAKAATTKGQLYSAYTAVQTLNVDALIGVSKNNFMMSNFTGLVDVATTDIKATKNAAELAPVEVEVERAVAKILVVKGAGFDANIADKDFTATLEGWAADVTNKKTFWSRKQTNTSAGVMEAPTYVRANMYAEDPNFSGFAGFPALLGNEFNYITLDKVTNPLAGYEYVLENTMVAIEQMTDVTTRVIIKAKYWPKYSSLDLAKKDLLTSGQPYYIYKKSLIFTPDQIAAISIGYPDWAAIEAANPVLAGFQALLQAGATKTAFGDDYTAPDTKSVLFGDLQYNYDGMNYYPVLIRHFDNIIQPTLMAYGRYGVVRNNIYEITVNSISGPGSIVVPGPDPNPTPDDNEGYVSVDIQILPWFIREQSVDL